MVVGCFVAPAMNAAQGTEPGSEREFTETVRPFLDCLLRELPRGREASAQLDLHRYTSVDSVVQDYPRWNRVREKLVAHQMPPPTGEAA